MKKLTLLITSFIILFASCTNDKVSIQGVIDNKYNEDTVYLYTIKKDSYDEFKLLAKSTVADGKFSFSKLADNKNLEEDGLPLIGYISLFDMQMTEEDLTDENANAPMATVILEKGNINLEFSNNSVIVGGTPRNEEFNKMHQAIKDFVEFTSQYTSLEELDTAPKDANGRDGRSQLQALDQALKDQSFAFIKANMKNSVGEYLFVRSGDEMFTPSQMLDLINSASDQFRAKPEVVQLKKILNEMNLGTILPDGIE